MIWKGKYLVTQKWRESICDGQALPTREEGRESKWFGNSRDSLSVAGMLGLWRGQRGLVLKQSLGSDCGEPSLLRLWNLTV